MPEQPERTRSNRGENDSLGPRLRALRKGLGVTVAEMGTLAGVTRNSWQQYEAGIKTPGGKVFQALARAGVNVNWVLIGGGSTMLSRHANAEERGVRHPGWYGYLYGKTLQRLASSPTFGDERLEALGEFTAFVVDVIPPDLNYAEELKHIDEVIGWLSRAIYGKDSPSTPDFLDISRGSTDALDPDHARIAALIWRIADANTQLHNLACNFVDRDGLDSADLEFDVILSQEEIRRNDIAASRRTLVTYGWVVYDPLQPTRGFLDSIRDPPDCIEFLETLLGSAQTEIRRRMDRLLARGLSVKPEDLERNFLYERLAQQQGYGENPPKRAGEPPESGAASTGTDDK